MNLNSVLGTKRIQALAAVAAGATVQTTSIIDTQGFHGAKFLIPIGSLTSGQTKGTVQVQGGQVSNGSDMANLQGVVLTIQDANANQWLVIDVCRCRMRYLQVVITRSTQSCALNPILCELYGTIKLNESDDPTTVGQTMLAVEPTNSGTGVPTTTTYGQSTTVVVTTTGQ